MSHRLIAGLVLGFWVAVGAASSAAAAEPEEWKPLWKARAKVTENTRFVSVADRLVFFDKKSNLMALNAESGKVAWKQKRRGKSTDADPALVSGIGDTIVVAWPKAKALVGYAASDGEVRWERPIGTVITGMDACQTKRVAVVSHRAASESEDLDQVLHGIDPATGETLWMHKAVGPVFAARGDYVWARDNRIGRTDTMAVHACTGSEGQPFQVEHGTIWRIDSVSGTSALAEVTFNRGTLRDVCVFDLKDTSQPPRCRDLHRTCGEGLMTSAGHLSGDTVWLAAVPMTGDDTIGGRLYKFAADKPKPGRDKGVGLTRQVLFNRGFAPTEGGLVIGWAGKGRKNPSLLRWLDADRLDIKAQAKLPKAPLNVATDAERAYVALVRGRLLAFSLPKASKTPSLESVPAQKSKYRCLADPTPRPSP